MPSISSILTKELLEELYWENGMTQRQIAGRYGTSERYVSEIMKRNGVRVKTKLELGEKYSDEYSNINVDFFLENTPKLAYIAGLLASDGNMDSTGSGNRFTLGMTDEDVIEWVSKEIGYKNKIGKNMSGKKIIHIISFSNHQVKKALVSKYKLTPDKSLTLEFPELTNELYSHFVRGVFDGDGSVNYDDEGNILWIGLNSASHEFIMGLKAVVDKVIGYEVNISTSYTKKGNPYYGYRFYGIAKVKTFYEWIYNNDSFGMKRKKEQLERSMESYIEKYNEKRKFKNDYVINGDTTIIFCKYKEHTHEVLIDTEDLDRVINNGGTWYVARKDKRYLIQQHNRLDDNKPFLLLKKFLLGISENVVIKQIDGNPFNCKKENLLIKNKSL